MKKTETREAVVLINKGDKLFGILHRPLVNAPYPAVLICHGFGGDKLGRNRLYLILAQELAEAGIATLRLDFHACGDSEGDFNKTTVDGLVSDAEVAIQFLKQDSQIDSERLGVLGRSLGGAVAVLAANRSKAFKSIVLWAPFFSAESWREQWKLLQTTQDAVKKAELMTINGKKASYDFYEQLFEIRLDKVLPNLQNIPLLHIQGKNDATILESHAQNYQVYRQGASGKSKFILLPNSDHDFSHLVEQRLSIDETVAWFKQTLN
ncbi:MAG: alpha/beta hydrolase [Parachlamydia sp.]|nr:MAG: alpha/beta hydrolase [Parachlamydia sp.]